MTIGYTNPAYPVLRNILNIVQGIDYRRVRPFTSILMKFLPQPILRKCGTTLLNAYVGGVGVHSVDLLHFFNVVGMEKIGKPFITTFETSLPRFNRVNGWVGSCAFDSMASERCKKLIAVSNYAYKRQKRVFEANSLSEVSEKLVVMHPPQKLLTTEDEICRKFEKSHPLHFVFVGSSFYGKGGAALLKALVKLCNSFDVRLTLIGKLDAVHEWRTDERIDSEAEIRKLLEENKSWVTHYERLPNEQVLSLLKNADVGFLPTRGDTYGYSVLEMQACGLPCATTNLRALPEINNDEIGWMIPVRCDEFGTEIADKFEDLALMDETIQQGLEKTCVEILSHPEQIQTKAFESFRAVGRRNDPLQFAESMKKIYEEALG